MPPMGSDIPDSMALASPFGNDRMRPGGMSGRNRAARLPGPRAQRMRDGR